MQNLRKNSDLFPVQITLLAIFYEKKMTETIDSKQQQKNNKIQQYYNTKQ